MMNGHGRSASIRTACLIKSEFRMKSSIIFNFSSGTAFQIISDTVTMGESTIFALNNTAMICDTDSTIIVTGCQISSSIGSVIISRGTGTVTFFNSVIVSTDKSGKYSTFLIEEGSTIWTAQCTVNANTGHVVDISAFGSELVYTNCFFPTVFSSVGSGGIITAGQTTIV
jgi:hypothetical protein